MGELTGTVESFTALLVDRRDVLVGDILDRIRRDGLPRSPLSLDPALRSVVRSETAMLVSRLIAGLPFGDPGSSWSPEASHLARLAVLHDTPLEGLVDSVRIAHLALQDGLFHAARDAGFAPAVALEVLQYCCRQLSQQVTELIELITEEYSKGLADDGADQNAILVRAVRRLLDGEPAAAEVLYDFDATHIAVVAKGTVVGTLAALAAERGEGALCLYVDRSVAWAWFTGTESAAVAAAVREPGQRGRLGFGAPGRGLDGFRQSHREAQSAYRVCEWTGRRSACFADVAPEAMGLADVGAARALVHQRLGRLAANEGREAALRRTLEVYLASGQTARSTALKLGLTERTIANRLQAARCLLPPDTELSSLELALALRLMPLVGDYTGGN